MAILFKLAEGTSYGLPVGGNAARLLAELLLNRIDRLLATERIHFIRFVDDYFLFADSKESAQRSLVTFSDALLRNEGLTLSRSKTRLMTKDDFLRASSFSNPEHSGPEDAGQKEFLKLRLTHDPYSPTATQDYEKMVEVLKKFDLPAMLTEELQKPRIDEVLIRQIVKAIRFLEQDKMDGAVTIILDNLEPLYPPFTNVAISIKQTQASLSAETRTKLFARFRELLRSESHITLVPANRVYAVRILSHDPSEDTEPLLVELYNRPKSDMMVKRDIILAMTRRRAAYWLSDLQRRSAVLTPWEKRAVLVASYTLGDEGHYWRKSITAGLSDVDKEFLRWISTKNNGRVWDLPL